jgi:hypothetical protein
VDCLGIFLLQNRVRADHSQSLRADMHYHLIEIARSVFLSTETGEVSRGSSWIKTAGSSRPGDESAPAILILRPQSTACAKPASANEATGKHLMQNGQEKKTKGRRNRH